MWRIGKSASVSIGLRAFRAIAIAILVLCCGATSSGIHRISDLAYATDANDRHRLDLYLPEHVAGAAVVVFAHGGAFMAGDRRDYEFVGRALALAGMAVAVPSYRLYPETDAQGSTQDVASAVAWIARHGDAYGLDVSKLFLVGHSAGGQIVAMIGTHARYLESAGSSLHVLRGVVSLAGAYDVRDLSDEPDSWQRIDDRIFGATPGERAKISASLDIDPKSPRFESVCGTLDDPGACDRATFFARALQAAKISARAVRVIGADHLGLLRAFVDPRDPLNADFRAFVETRVGDDER